MYRVEWLDIDGEQKVVRGFKKPTSGLELIILIWILKCRWCSMMESKVDWRK